MLYNNCSSCQYYILYTNFITKTTITITWYVCGEVCGWYLVDCPRNFMAIVWCFSAMSKYHVESSKGYFWNTKDTLGSGATAQVFAGYARVGSVYFLLCHIKIVVSR